MNAHLFNPVVPKRNFEDVARQIKQLVYSGDLRPSDRLPPEREMAKQFNTSRTTIREALRTLEETGFIEMKTGISGGAFVRYLDAHRVTQSIIDLVKVGQVSLDEIMQARLSIELSVMDAVLNNIDDTKLKELADIISVSSQLLKQEDNFTRTESNMELVKFHVKLAEISGNRLYEYLIESLTHSTMLFIKENAPYISRNPNHLKQHHQLYEMVRIKDLEGAKALLIQHINETRRHIKKGMRRPGRLESAGENRHGIAGVDLARGKK